MGWIRRIFFGEKDPYEFGVSSMWRTFAAKGFFTAESACGYKFRYSLECHYNKVDHKEFKASRMLEKLGEERFLDALNNHVVLPALRSKKRFVRLLTGYHPYPVMCYIAQEAGEPYVAVDHTCIELNKELSGTRFSHFGCEKVFIDFRLHKPTDNLIEENYNRMRKLFDLTSVQSKPEYIAAEEALLVAAAKREMDLEKIFRHGQTDQTHKGESVTITTRLVGRAVEIAWKFNKHLPGNESMRGYRKEGGFWTGTLPLEHNGTCIAESRNDDSTILTLPGGTDNFFTFAVVRPGSEGPEVVESLRFSVRVPSQEELARVDELIKTAVSQSEQKAKLSEKTSAALLELTSFIEFDENVSELEKQLVERISSKDYSDEEKEEKIQRLKDVVQSLRIEHS